MGLDVAIAQLYLKQNFSPRDYALAIQASPIPHLAEHRFLMAKAADKKVNVAIIGLGFGAEFIPIYQHHPNANMYAICQRNEQRLQKVGDEFGIATRYADYDDVLA